jgi:hypothetical protein
MDYVGALKLLRERFPQLSHFLPEPDDPDFDNSDVYHAFSEFAEQAVRRQSDEKFFSSVCTFIDDLALSGQSVLQELFGEVLETLAQDAEFCRRLRPHIHSETREALRIVEREMYGR